jgi:hypothetical protein
MNRPPAATMRTGLAARRIQCTKADRTFQMTYIDSAILDATEWFCRRFQVLTGRTNVWLAIQFTNLSIIVYFVWAAGVFLWVRDPGLRIALGLFCAGVLYALTQTVFKVSIEAYERSAYHRVAKGLRNPRRVRDALLRIPFLTLSLVLFYPTRFIYVHLIEWALPRASVHIAALSYFLVVLTTVVLYLLACDPLPPCSSKVRAWLRGLSPARGVHRAGAARSDRSPGAAGYRDEVVAGGMRDETYAAIFTKSSSVSFTTTRFIRSAHSPRRVPACMSYIWRTR